MKGKGWFNDRYAHAMASKGIQTRAKSKSFKSKGIFQYGIRYENNAPLEGATVFHARSGPPKGKEQIVIYDPEKNKTYYLERYEVSSVPNEDLISGSGYDKIFELPYGKYQVFSKEIWLNKGKTEDLEEFEEPHFFVAVRVPYESKDYKTKFFKYSSSISDWPPEKILDEMSNITKWQKIPDKETWNEGDKG